MGTPHASPQADLTDTEGCLLSCLMLPDTGADTLQKCREAGVTAFTFTRQENAELFRLIAGQHDAGAHAGIGDELIRSRPQHRHSLMLLTGGESVQTSTHVTKYIADLKLAETRKQVRGVAAGFNEAAASPGANPEELILELRGQLDRLISGPVREKPAARSLMTLTATDEERRGANLLGVGFLRRGQGLLMPGATGIGKSSLSMQALVLWALGKSFFGIKPQGPLTSLLVQAENDDIDLVEMREGVCAGLNLSNPDRSIVASRIFVLTAHERGTTLFSRLEVEVKKLQPDLLVLDPLFAYMEGAVKDQSDATVFLRAIMQPFLVRHNLAAIVLHHTNKPPSGKEKSTWQGGDFAYAGSGSIEFANWARAVIMLRSIGKPDVFELMLPKRGKRAGICDASGTPTTSVMIRHARTPGTIFWELADANDTSTEKPKVREPAILKAFYSMSKDDDGGVDLPKLAKKLRVSEKTIRRDLQGGAVKTEDGEWLEVEDKKVFARD